MPFPDREFFATVPVFTEFEGVADAGNYRPLPDGWILALADIVGSTQAIEGGRYKDVNMAGASVISAVLNAVGKGDLSLRLRRRRRADRASGIAGKGCARRARRRADLGRRGSGLHAAHRRRAGCRHPRAKVSTCGSPVIPQALTLPMRCSRAAATAGPNSR